MSINDFINFFAKIRVTMNWEKLLAHSPTVAIREISDREELIQLIVPWYRTEMEFDARYDAPGARAMSVREVEQNFDSLPEKKRNGTQQNSNNYLNADAAISIYLPAYQLPQNLHLLLDGNHRTIALARITKPFSLKLISIVGPIDPEILPDLGHWLES